MSDEGDWSDSERETLVRLRRPLTAPPDVERRIVAELRSRGLLRSPLGRPLQAVAAAVVLIAAVASGALLDRALARRGATAARFMLLLYGGGEDQSRRVEYSAWARSVAAGGIDISGEELSSAAEELANGAAHPVSWDSLPRGYFIVGTSNLDEARRIASTCPHLRYGGRIVIRGIASTP